MERLTYKKSRSRWDEGKYPTKYTSRHTFQEVVARLAAYEDTGLEPKHVAELAQAEKDGRLVVLPCKLHESIFYLEDGELFDDVPYEVSIGQKSGEWNDTLMFECQDGFGFYAEDIGKTVFLTSEEAETALKKRGEA